MGIRDVSKYLKKIPEFQKKAELHDAVCVKTLEIVDEINMKLDKIITEIEKNE